MVTEERKQRLAPWRCFSWFRECTIGGRCPAISFSVTTHPCSYLEADMPGYDSRGMPESTPCEWSMPQGYCGASASLVQNIVWAANPVLPITFDFLHFTHSHTDFVHVGIHLSQADISMSQKYSSDHSISSCVYISHPNRIQLEITRLCSVWFSGKKIKN